MAITAVQDFYYNVENMERAKKFYSEVLGCKVLDTNPWWTTLDCYGMRVGLHGEGPESKPLPIVPRNEHGARAGGTLTLKSDNIQADFEWLKSRGVKILGEINESWGKLVVFEDSESNVLKLMELPQKS